MNTSKQVFSRVNSVLLVLGLAGLLASCNHLNSDPDTISPNDPYLGDPIYVDGKSSTIIDLTARVHASVPVTFTITSQPAKGTLSLIDKGLFSYSPYPSASTTSDKFFFNVLDSNNNVLEHDSIPLVIEPDAVKLPCGIYAHNDIFYTSATQNSNFYTSISILPNDVICGLDSTQYQISIAQAPAHGTASILFNRYVSYTLSGAPVNDSLIYKILSLKDPTVYSYAVLTIVAPANCFITLLPDHYDVNLDSIAGDSVVLKVFSNDKLCKPIHEYPPVISLAPVNGTAIYRNSPDVPYIVYFPNSVSKGSFAVDSLHYRFCADQCQESTATMRITNP